VGISSDYPIFFRVTPIISETGKATNFNFGTHIHCVSKSMWRYLFEDNSNINCPIIIIFDRPTGNLALGRLTAYCTADQVSRNSKDYRASKAARSIIFGERVKITLVDYLLYGHLPEVVIHLFVIYNEKSCNYVFIWLFCVQITLNWGYLFHQVFELVRVIEVTQLNWKVPCGIERG